LVLWLTDRDIMARAVDTLAFRRLRRTPNFVRSHPNDTVDRSHITGSARGRKPVADEDIAMDKRAAVHVALALPDRSHEQGTCMSDLATLAIDAHGGLDRWRRLKTVSARLLQDGVLWKLKGQESVLDDVHLAERT
jgi:hypothetical protein